MKLEWRDLEFMVRSTNIAFLGFLCKTTTMLKPLLPYRNFQKIGGGLLNMFQGVDKTAKSLGIQNNKLQFVPTKSEKYSVNCSVFRPLF